MKKEKIIFTLVPILAAILVAISYMKVANLDNDAIKFKMEYEEYNEKETGYGQTYQVLDISEKNKIKYSTYEEIINVINEGSGIIYLGFPECPWCRTAIPVLFDVVNDNNIDTIYYLNIKDDRDSYVVEDGKVQYALDNNGNEIKGSEGYLNLLKELDEYLTDYTITKDGKTYEVGEKRIYAPSVIFVKDGNVLGIQVSTVSGQKSGFDKLTKEQYQELYGIYENYVLDMTSNTCTKDSAC